MTNHTNQQTKTYLARSVDDAITQAREELGEDATLLNTRRLAPGQGSAGGYEVVFGVPELLPEAPVTVTPTPAPPPRTPRSDFAGELEQLQVQMDEIRALLASSAKPRVTGRAPVGPAINPAVVELAEVHARLISSEVDPSLSKDILQRLEASVEAGTSFQRGTARSDKAERRWKAFRFEQEGLAELIRAELERRVPLEPWLDDDSPAVALIGPSGSGKTTTAAKLASLLTGPAEARPVRILSFDPSPRSQEAAQSLGVAFTKVPETRALPSLVAEARRTESVLIDMPGCGVDDRKAAEASAAALRACQGIDVHLVVPGYMKASDLRRCIQRFEIFRPSKLLVTKMDETHAFGSVYSEAARAGMALSFLAHGPAIPRDIRPASADDLLALALERRQSLSRNVA